ncbi:MAG: flagellar motor switch protein FliG [Acidimicrobiales bacterium]
MSRLHELTGAEKAAILLLSLDQEQAARVLKQLRDDEVSEIITEIAALHVVEQETVAEIVEVFSDTRRQDVQWTRGGIDQARALLENTVEPARVEEIFALMDKGVIAPPFAWLAPVAPDDLAAILQRENPQTAAIVMSFLDPDAAAAVLRALPEEYQQLVGIRIGELGEPSPDLIEKIEVGLRERIGPDAFKRQYGVGGINTLVALLNRSDRGTEREVLEALAQHDEELAIEVRRRLFVFEDIASLDDRAIQSVLRSVDSKLLPMALKGVRPEVQRKITDNLSQRAAQNLVEEIELLGPVRAADVEAAQAAIVALIGQLEQSGEIMISRGNDALIA